MINDYKISLTYDDFFANSNKIISEQIEVVGEAITFYTDKESIKYLEENNISYMLHESKSKNIKSFFINKSGMVIAVLLIMFIVYINGFRVSKITFNAEYPINPLVEEYISGQTKELLFFSFGRNNYNELASNLRSTFSEYEWISIDKKGSVLNVTILPSTTKDISYENLKVGNIVANKDGMVESFVVFNGTSLVHDKMYVKKGDVLVDGITSNTHAKGYVLATTFETVKIVVDKEEIKEEYTGIKSKYYILDIFSVKLNINKKKKYEKMDSKTHKVFTIPYIITLNQIEEYEKNGIMYVYDKDSAKEYAKSIILDDFSATRKLDSERVDRIEALSVTENKDSFEVVFLVKKIESIGVFKEIL